MLILGPSRFTDDIDLLTVTDIIKELEKQRRDLRPKFKTATFADGVETLQDLTQGIVLENTVINGLTFGICRYRRTSGRGCISLPYTIDLSTIRTTW